ncbi:MAG TPA: type II secretion system F family protein [Chloroflexia bacterium]|nr:type II secretion system F family protein [Chloroflexia bacterium]
MASIFKRKGSNVNNRLSEYAGAKNQAAQVQTASGARALVNDRIEKAVQGKGFAVTIQRNLARADLKLTVAEFIGLKILSTAVGFGVGTFLGRDFKQFALVVGLLVAIIFMYIPDMFVKRRGNKRIKTFNNQLGDTITLAANSLRSGYSLLQSMELISREAPSPISDEFQRVIREISLGLSTREALANMLRRVPSDDLDLLITAINIQSEVGGNLAQILDSIGHTIRERVRIKGEIKVLTAQQQYAGYIISGLPVALAGVLMLIAPSFMTKMFVWPWICMPICGLILIGIGFWAIMKIVDIDV